MRAKQHPSLQSSWQPESQGPETVSISRAIKFGLIGSLAGTIAMDLIMVVESLIIGQAAYGFVTLIGSAVGGGTLTGVVVHLLTGTSLGLFFGIGVAKVRFFTIESVRKGVWLGLLTGLVTIPFGCVPFAILVSVPIIEMVSFSSIPHLAWGAVLGLIAGYTMPSGLRSARGLVAH
jgi:hypothetical protein